MLAVRLNHTMSDSPGLALFLNAVCQMSRGANVPSVLPVWERELLDAPNPPCITCTHYEYDELHNTKGTLGIMDDDNTVHRSFFFGPKEIRALKTRISQTVGPCSTFEAVTACLWRCRTIAFGGDPDKIVRFSFPVNIRGKGLLQLPSGYYGNAFVFPAAVSKAGEICKNPLGYAVQLVKKVKAEVSKEYIKSAASLIVSKGRPSIPRTGSFIISDNRGLGFEDLDFGWGKPLYGGPAKAISLISFFMRFKNSRGEEDIVVPICLPLPVMKRFEEEVKGMIGEEADEVE